MGSSMAEVNVAVIIGSNRRASINRRFLQSFIDPFARLAARLLPARADASAA
jgi:hypothetical protein